MKKHSKEFLENLTPYQAYELLLNGNKRFLNNLNEDQDHLEILNQVREGQYPFAVILSCMDSRTSSELIFDQGLGDLFSIRVAGNIVNNDILASIEYALKYIGTKVLMVLGHTNCGAIKSAKQGTYEGHLTGLLNRIKPSITKSMLNDGSTHLFSDRVSYANVENSLEEILQGSEIVRDLFEKGSIGIVGAVYDIETGEVDFFKNLTTKTPAKQVLVTA